MACRGCANLQCNCFTKDTDTVTSTGNGTQYAPFTFRPKYTPSPRPFGHLYGRTDQALDGAPYSLFDVITDPDIDQGGNMNVGNRTSLVVPSAGIYLVGITVPFMTVATDPLIDNFTIRKNTTPVSTGTFVHNASFVASLAFVSATTLLDLNVNDVLDCYVERLVGAGTVTVDSAVAANFVSHVHLWAIWMGGPI